VSRTRPSFAFRRAAAAAALLALAPVIPASPAHSAALSGRAAPNSPARAQRVPAGDEIVTATGDIGGWHLYAASAGDGWRWHALATLQPNGYDEERWIGEQCLTGDGRFVVTVVAPWHANNSAAGMDSGGLAYAVDAHTGTVRPLVGGVSIAYFNPGCGTGSTVALTSYGGTDQDTTRVLTVDAGTGTVKASTTVVGEFTSAIPVSGGIVAAEGRHLVRLAGDRATTLATAPGQALELRADRNGGVDLLSASRDTSTIWRLASDRLTRIGSGPLDAVDLLAGRGGITTVTGATSLDADSGLRAAGSPAGGVQAASLDGTVLLPDAQPTSAAATPAHPGSGRVLVGVTGGRVVGGVLPAPAAERTTTLPTVPNVTAPACAVPRLDIWNQVLQPNSAQVDWAIQQATRGWLVSADIPARPTTSGTFKIGDNTALPAYYPSTDFPPGVILNHAGVAVPPQVVRGILAQESNWDQASWHAAIGDGGDPLVADYYGSSNPSDPSDINYTNADCGYGIGQLTDIMRSGAAAPAKQVAVATDYAENVAATVQALVSKWNQLLQLPKPITTNNNDPTKLENWYTAIWAYNSGVHNGDGGYGLGWFNNPANPIYPANRHAFLHTWANSTPVQTYGDAATPQNWPYQEKVFGWMEVPQLDPSGHARYTATYNWSNGTGRFLVLPGFMTFCSTTVNHCDPTQPANPCPAVNSSCWWDAPVQWVDCTAGSGQACNAESFTITSRTAPEPAATHLDPACTVSGLPAGAIIVDDLSLTANPGTDPGSPAPNPGNLNPNVVGCPLHRTWTSNGTFTFTDGAGTTISDQDPAAIDLHQLGVGFGGHIWFTHTRPPSDNARVAVGTWTPNLPASEGVYQVFVFVPDNGATTDHAVYTIGSQHRVLNQNAYSNQWVSLGYFDLFSGDQVSLTSQTDTGDNSLGSDVAFDAVAFARVPAGGYVALGDSYSSGEGAGPWDEGTDAPFNSTNGDNGDLCHRSANAYPLQYAAMTSTFAGRVVDLACSGSNLADIDNNICYNVITDGSVLTCDNTSPNVTVVRSSSPNPDFGGTLFYHEQTQLTMLRAMQNTGSAPNLVTVSMGGNDAGFAQVVGDCVQDVFLLKRRFCQGDFQNPDGSDQISNRIWGLEMPLVQALSDIRAAVPNAIVVLIGYPSIFQYDPNLPADDVDCSKTFNQDRAWLINLASQYDEMAQAAVSLVPGVTYAPMLHAFGGHELCTANEYVHEPDGPLPIPSDPRVYDQWFHPNTQGYQAEAVLLKAILGIP